MSKINQGKRFKALLNETKNALATRPCSKEELIEQLEIAEYHEEILDEVLAVLVEQGIAEIKQGKYSRKKTKHDVLTGVIRMHPRGFGFVQLDSTELYTQDVFIPKPYTQNAVDGDRVEVMVNPTVLHPKGPEGKVSAILSRGRTHVAGIIHGNDRYGNALAYVPLMGAEKVVIVEAPKEGKLKVGDRLVMQVIDWGEEDTPAHCKIVHIIGHISDPSCDIPAAIEEYELRNEFPNNVVAEAKAYGAKVLAKDLNEREDLRKVETFTIDPKTAKDFDDALSLDKDKNGHYHLIVHIADVSHYVKGGSALDTEAKQRSNSTYFPGRCVPMLPPELSENLCSLKPNVNRLAASVFMEFGPDGTLLNSRMAKTVIRSQKRFTYSEAKEVLDGKKSSEHAPKLKLMVELCHLLKKKRYERGSLEFALPELRILVDEKGTPTGTETISYDITHQLVEEFMLKANEIVAQSLCELGIPIAYRIHETPADESLRDFSILAGAFGYSLSEKPSQHEIQKLFDEAMDTEYGQYLATSYIRRMRLAVYSPDNIGHYGLCLTHYCHFTSPIRRYVDLLIHRALFGEPMDKESLEMIATHCSEQERISDKAENSVILLKKLRLLSATRKKHPFKTYQAVVTRVRNFGVIFEILDYMLEGFFSLSELHSDYYIFDEEKGSLIGSNTGVQIRAGNRIEVMLSHIDFITLESQWSLVRDQPKKRKKR